MIAGSRITAAVSIAVLAGFAAGASGQGLVLAQAPAAPAASAGSGGDSYGWSHWYVGTGIGAAFSAKFKLNGQVVSFSDALQGSTDKGPLIAMNVVNAGIALSPTLLLGFSGSLVSQTATIAGEDAQVQINNYFAALTYFPFERGLFVRGGGGLSTTLVDLGPGDGSTSRGLGILAGVGYALPIVGRHHITLTADVSRQFYKSSSSKAEDSQFGAVYVGYLYRR